MNSTRCGRQAGGLRRLAVLSFVAAVTVDAASAPPRWIEIGPPGADTIVAAVDPAVPDRVYAATLDTVAVSLDGGRIFSKLGSFAIEKSDWRPSPFIASLAVLREHGAGMLADPGIARLIVAFTAPTDDVPTVHTSLDGGRTWSPGVNAETGKPIGGNWKQLASAPGSANVAFATNGFGGDGNFRTDDGGSTWRPFTIPEHVGGPGVFLPVTASTLITVDETGLRRTTDGGGTWGAISAGLPPPPTATSPSPRIRPTR